MSGSDGSTTWMDRATMRGLALGFVLNFLLSSLAWVDLFDYYDVRVAASTMAAQTLAASWFILQVTRRRFRLTDFQAVLVVHIAVLTVLLVALDVRTRAPRTLSCNTRSHHARASARAWASSAATPACRASW